MSLVKGGVTHIRVWKTCSQTRGTFPASFFFQWKSIFFLQWVLMLWPYAGGCRADNRPQCADRPRLPTLSPPFPLQLSPLQGHKPASVRAINCTNDTVWARTPTPQPPFLPKTPSAHIHLTLPLSVLSTYPPKTCFPHCLAEAWCAGLGCLIYYTTYWLATASGRSIQIL